MPTFSLFREQTLDLASGVSQLRVREFGTVYPPPCSSLTLNLHTSNVLKAFYFCSVILFGETAAHYWHFDFNVPCISRFTYLLTGPGPVKRSLRQRSLPMWPVVNTRMIEMRQLFADARWPPTPGPSQRTSTPVIHTHHHRLLYY